VLKTICPKKAMAFFVAFLILGMAASGRVFAQAAPQASPAGSGEAAIGSAEAAKPQKPRRKLPTGLLELQGFKYPVYLYVPEGLEQEKKYPLLVMVPSETDSAEKQLEYILPVAKSLECFVLATYNLWPKQGTPYEIDRWLLGIKNDMSKRFPIDASKIYAIGRNSGGSYAAYLITAYPEEFSGAALLGEAWEGPFMELLKPRVSAGDQMPVVAAFTADQQTTKIKNEKWVLEYQQKGYPVSVMDLPAGQDFDSSDFKVSLLEWLDQKSQSWKLIREEQHKTFKQRFKKGVKEFFEV
jgi:hypothetical protein